MIYDNHPGEVQYALRINCAKNRCNTPHDDDGEVVKFITPEQAHPIVGTRKVNGHAADLVKRVIPEWETVHELKLN